MEVVHCINLAKREDRLLAAAKESKEQCFCIKFWEGIDEPARKDVKKAICLSHKRIVRFAQENNLPYVNIMEDDCQFFAPGAFQYWVDNIPKLYDFYCGLVYVGSVNEENKITNGMSGVLTLYRIPNHFFSYILNEVPDDCHLDRFLGDTAFLHNYYVSPKMVCQQRGGYSDNLKMNMKYDVYLEGKSIFGRE